MLELVNISKKYNLTRALEGVSLTFAPGEIVGLFGENGAGKTTLLKSILGLVLCEGRVLLDGEPVTRKNIRRLSFATSEHSFFPGITAAAHRDFYREHFPNFREKRFNALMEFFDLPMDHRHVGHMSTGQKNQFEVILALSQGADYILMDEPFSGSDVFNREDFYKVLMGILEPTETIILSTHLPEEVDVLISRAVLLSHGRLVGDVQISDLEDRETDLMTYLRSVYGYQPDRVGRAIDRLTGEGDR